MKKMGTFRGKILPALLLGILAYTNFNDFFSQKHPVMEPYLLAATAFASAHCFWMAFFLHPRKTVMWEYASLLLGIHAAVQVLSTLQLVGNWAFALVGTLLMGALTIIPAATVLGPPGPRG